MPVCIANAPDVAQALAALIQGSNEDGEVGRVAARDLRGGGQVLEAERLDGPRWVTRQDVEDPGLLGAGEHGAAIVA